MSECKTIFDWLFDEVAPIPGARYEIPAWLPMKIATRLMDEKLRRISTLSGVMAGPVGRLP